MCTPLTQPLPLAGERRPKRERRLKRQGLKGKSEVAARKTGAKALKNNKGPLSERTSPKVRSDKWPSATDGRTGWRAGRSEKAAGVFRP